VGVKEPRPICREDRHTLAVAPKRRIKNRKQGGRHQVEIEIKENVKNKKGRKEIELGNGT
jgi:hypothetical protein